MIGFIKMAVLLLKAINSKQDDQDRDRVSRKETFDSDDDFHSGIDRLRAT